jgi:hypothetical protein
VLMIVYNNYTCMHITYYEIKNDQRNKCKLELRTYTEVVPFKEKSSFHFVVLAKILNGMEYKLGIEFKYI